VADVATIAVDVEAEIAIVDRSLKPCVYLVVGFIFK